MTITKNLKSAMRAMMSDALISFSVLMTGTFVPVLIIGLAFMTNQLYLLCVIPLVVYTAFTHQKGWMLQALCLGEYRWMPRYTVTARVISSHDTKSEAETRSVCKQAHARWPYGGWYIYGEQFLVVSFVHDGKSLRTAIRVKQANFEELKPGDRLEISYQFSRGPDEPQLPVLAQVTA